MHEEPDLALTEGLYGEGDFMGEEPGLQEVAFLGEGSLLEEQGFLGEGGGMIGGQDLGGAMMGGGDLMEIQLPPQPTPYFTPLGTPHPSPRQMVPPPLPLLLPSPTASHGSLEFSARPRSQIATQGSLEFSPRSRSEIATQGSLEFSPRSRAQNEVEQGLQRIGLDPRSPKHPSPVHPPARSPLPTGSPSPVHLPHRTSSSGSLPMHQPSSDLDYLLESPPRVRSLPPPQLTITRFCTLL